jgi:hypothetical protein
MDTTSWNTKAKCMDELRVTWRELEILEPRNVICYSGSGYDEFIDRYTSSFDHVDITDKHHSFLVGKKQMLWWERHCLDRNGRKFRFLRTSHPERKNKPEFVDPLVRWLRNADL